MPPSFEVEVVGDGEPSDSGWEFAASGMLVVTDVGDSAPSVVTVMCEGVCLRTLGGILWNRSPFQEVKRLED